MVTYRFAAADNETGLIWQGMFLWRFDYIRSEQVWDIMVERKEYEAILKRSRWW